MNYAIVFENPNPAPIVNCKESLLGKPILSYILTHLSQSKIDKTICMVDVKDFFLFPKAEQEMPCSMKQIADMMDLLKEDGFTLFIPANVLFLDAEGINGLLTIHKKNHHSLTLGTMLFNRPLGYVRVNRKNRRVISVVEEEHATAAEKLINEVSSGIFCVNHKVLKSFLLSGKSSFIDLIQYVSKTYKVDTYMFTDKARGICDVKDLVLAEERIREQICDTWLKRGVRLENPKTVLIGPEVIIEERVTIFSNTRILGKTRIHKGARIGPNTTIENSIVCKDVWIRDSIVEDSRIKEGTIVGPFAVKLGN